MPDTSTIIKYIKIRALAERGDRGEQDNAARILQRMEKENPNIEEAAKRYMRSQNRANGPGPGSTSSGFPERGFSFTGNWSEIFNFAKDVAYNVSDFANTVANAYAGQLLAEEVESNLRATKAGNVLVTLRMTLAVYQRARRLNVMQQETFRATLHQMLDEELDALLGVEDEA
jgi:hypothetical protein